MAAGERFVFTLGERAYYAHVSDDGLLCADSLTRPTRAKAIRRSRPHYDEPLPFVLDCYSDAGLAPPATPFDAHALVRSLATNEPFRGGGGGNRRPDSDDEAAPVAAQTTAVPPRVVSEVLWNDCACATTLNRRLGSYKAAALALEATVARLLCALDGYESLIERLLANDASAREEARHLLDERAQRLARLLNDDDDIRAAASSPPLQLDQLSIDALIGD